MNVLYCGDKNISDGLLISVLSLMEHVKEPLQISILTAGVQTATKEIEPLSQIITNDLDVLVQRQHPESFVLRYDISDLFAQELPVANMETRFTPCCMLRLYADLLPDLPDRMLYLDNDVICRKDCSAFYHQDLTGYELAGVLDHYGKWFFHQKPFRMDYFNSGVLLLNMKEIRSTGLFRKCRRHCADEKMFMPDQSALNKLAVHKKEQPRCFNEQRELQPDTVFQHFTTSFRFWPKFHTVSVKPWQIDRMHEVLHLYAYDELLSVYQKEKSQFGWI